MGAETDASWGSSGEEAELNLDVSCGGVELFLPKAWHVENEMNLSLSGIEEKNSSMSAGTPVLRLTGKAGLSGITILYV